MLAGCRPMRREAGRRAGDTQDLDRDIIVGDARAGLNDHRQEEAKPIRRDEGDLRVASSPALLGH